MAVIKLKTINRERSSIHARKIYLSSDLPARLVVGSLCLDCRAFDLRIDDRTVRLTPAEFDLLYHMMSRPGEIFSAEELLTQVWQYPPGKGQTVLVRAHIKNLRNKIEDNPKKPVRLKTIGHLGYTISDG